jgi:hypothetical protein
VGLAGTAARATISEHAESVNGHSVTLPTQVVAPRDYLRLVRNEFIVLELALTRSTSIPLTLVMLVARMATFTAISDK